MRFIKRYLIPRLVQYVLMISIGLTVMFILPRMLPLDPVMARIHRQEALMGTSMDPAAMERMIEIKREMFGLEEGLFRQYLTFWRRFFTFDFGPSLLMFPTPVNQLLLRALPWTVGLLLASTLLGWIIGNILGGLAGYFRRSRLLKIIDGITMFVRPIPPYIMALMFIICFAFLIPIFPLRGALPIGMEVSWSWAFLREVSMHAFLPIMSLALLGVAGSLQGMRLFVQSVKDEDFVRYAKLGNVKEGTIFGRYVMRNALLPAVTGLSLALGSLFSGALITEMVFSYPGVGLLGFQAALAGDFNLMMGAASMSIVLLATTIFLIDVLYPLLDPRIRLR